MVKKIIFSFIVIWASASWVNAHVVLEDRLTNASFEPGETINISWSILVEHDQIDWNLYFSQDGGSTWEPIQEGLPIEQVSYAWAAPDIESSKMLVQIIQHNDITEDYFDISDTFSIHAQSSTPVLALEPEVLEASIAPNPVHDLGLLTVHSAGQDLSVTIFDNQGRRVEKLQENRFNNKDHLFYWKTSNLTNGIYYIEIAADRQNRFLPVILNH